MKSYILPFLLIPAGALPAQGITSPAHFTGAEGPTNSNLPFGTTRTPYRYLQVHNDLSGHPMTIKALVFRRDGARTTTFGGYQFFTDLTLSTAKTSSSAPNKTFDLNHGADKTKVGSFQQVKFPGSSFGDVPAPFTYRIPLTKPFNFGGKGPLCWEARVQVRQNNFHVYFDACSSSNSNPYGWVVRTGTSCKASAFTSSLYFSGSQSMNWPKNTGTLVFNASRAPKNAVAFILIGLDKKSLGGLPLPLEIPGTTGAKSGSCFLSVAPILILPAFTTSTGSISNYQFGFPVTPSFNGASIHTQLLAPDAPANPMGVVTSNLVSFHFLAPYKTVPVGNVYLSGTGNTGSVRANYGLVVRFE